MVKRRPLHPKPLLDEPSLQSFLDGHGVKHVHMRTIWRHTLAHPECRLDEIPGIPDKIRGPLQDEFALYTSTVVQTMTSQVDGTVKLLIRLQDGGEVEAVLIHHSGMPEHPDRRQEDRCGQRDTLCLSSQVGCRLGCTFCATGTMGLQGNLWAGEIQEQLLHAQSVRSVSNVVFMGMGEPLENYDAVASAITGLSDTHRFGLAPSSITVSTVGIVGNIRRLIEELPKVKLALSLHAPTQELRERLVPAGRSFKVDDLMQVIDDYAALHAGDGKKKGMIMVSYVLLKDVNDSLECAEQLRDLLVDRPVIVNLIPYNPFEGNQYNYESPAPEQFYAFLRVLMAADIRVLERRHHGRDISAACGQLAKLGTSAVTTDLENCGVNLSPQKTTGPAVAPPLKKEAAGRNESAIAVSGCMSKMIPAILICGLAALLLSQRSFRRLQWKSPIL